MASGKISTFLRYGIPVLMNEIGIYADLAVQYQFGLIASDIDELADSLYAFDRIDFGENARAFYSEYLDFDNFKDLLWEKTGEVVEEIL